MGARAQVLIQDEGVYLYTHWGSGSLGEDLKRALAKRWRWTDPEYLARIIFDEMKGADFEETGYGIGTSAHGDLDYEPFVVNCHDQTVTTPEGVTMTFEEFVA